MLGLFPPERYAIWYAEVINCVARAKSVSSRGKRNPRVVKRRTSYYPSRKGDEPLNVLIQTVIRVKNTSN
jgi:hypothetical protein